MFSSIITPRNLVNNSRFISILFKVIVGNLNRILSHAPYLSKKEILSFPSVKR